MAKIEKIVDKMLTYRQRPSKQWSDPQSELLNRQNPESDPKLAADPRTTVYFKSANPLNLSQKSTIRTLLKAKYVDPRTYSLSLYKRTQCAGLLSLRTVGATKNLPQNTASRFESTARDPKIPKNITFVGQSLTVWYAKGEFFQPKGSVTPTSHHPCHSITKYCRGNARCDHSQTCRSILLMLELEYKSVSRGRLKQAFLVRMGCRSAMHNRLYHA